LEILFFLDLEFRLQSEQALEVLKLPYQPVVEYEQADVSTVNCNEIFLIFIINSTNYYYDLFL
ncbi:hypothetical protein T11_2663, partial [Trichinella zimbabwensis]